MKICNKKLLGALFLAVFITGCGASDFFGGPDGVAVDTVGSGAESTPPTVSSTSPISTATGVALNKKITVTFSEAMLPATCTTTTFTLKQGTTPVTGTVTCVNKTAVFDPITNLLANTEYTATITTGVKDLAGNRLAANRVWTFTTGSTTDTTAPSVSSTDPTDAATSVARNQNITATFSEAVDPATITGTTFTLKQGTTAVSGTVTSSGSTATFAPTTNLDASTVYTATITTGVKDLADNALAANKVWTFTTGTTTAAGPSAVVLGTAGAFAILTKSGVTDIPTSIITGDVGASPISGTAIGVTCAEVTGTIYSVDAAGPLPCRVTDPTLLTTAVGDMEIAYTDAAGRTLPNFTELGAGEIGGLTLVPGLYKWGTNVLISTNVTLSGGANDVWIFQIAQNLTISNAKTVTLAGGAQAKNVFWQVAGQATLGTTANFKGTILSQTAIIMNTSSVMTGRALAQTAVTLDHTTVTKP